MVVSKHYGPFHVEDREMSIERERERATRGRSMCISYNQLCWISVEGFLSLSLKIK